MISRVYWVCSILVWALIDGWDYSQMTVMYINTTIEHNHVVILKLYHVLHDLCIA